MSILRSAILALALPASLAAQAAAPPSANPITTAFKNRITGLHRNLAQAFDSIPEAKYGYKPTPAQLTIGYIAQHVASDSYFFCNNFGAAKADVPAADAATPDSVRATWPREKLLTNLKASFAFCVTAFDQVDDAKLADAISITFNGNTRNSTRANMVLGHALDLADHYSQIANYMRLNNMLPPSALPRPAR
jgi:DinB superfamily